MSIFKAKKEISQSEIDVECGARILITPPGTRPAIGEEPEEIIPATVNFQIEGVKPVDLLDKEWETFEKMFVVIARRIPNLKEVKVLNATKK